mmetsp:Transcript_29336/g.92600  ORF Transcript_29336/g.92600 Transcript_29336/m.92600 type:complete len:847 (-) Transcript_29336:54-2594(-)
MGCTSSTSVVGGYAVGDSVYYGGPTKTIKNSGEQLVFGAPGEVVGQTCRGDVMVTFPTGVGKVSIRPLELSRTVPDMPGGYCLGDRVYYGGPARKYPNGDQLLFSAQGEVAGRSCVGDSMDSERLAVMFPSHRDAKAVRLALLSREPPVIPGGYSVGDCVFWCGMNWTFPNGDRLRFGAKGEVAGRSCVGDGNDDERVAVNFPGNKGAVAMRLPEISHEPPVIPGGYRIGDRVFYAYPNWRAPDGHVLCFGVQGKVIGRSCIGDGKDDERVWVLFPGLGYGCICLEQISNEPPVIPGGYSLGERVFYGGPNRPAGCNGDRLTFGARGEVAGRATSSRSTHNKADLAVVFPGNEDAVDVRLAEVSREVPVIPGGHILGDVVFFGGADVKYSNGDRLTFGARGEVAGRCCTGDGHDDERVAVTLPGNRSAANLNLSEISRGPPPNLKERLTVRLKAASGRQDVPDEEASVDITELAIVHQTAVGAGIEAIAEQALQTSLAKIERGQRNGDVALLSEVLRAAEDIDWQELKLTAQLTLEQVALPKVLQAAEESGDLFCQLAVELRAKERGFDRLAERAASLVHKAEVTDVELKDLRADRRQLRQSEADGVLVRQMQQLLDETYTGWGGFGKRTRTRDRPNEKVADHLEVSSVVQLRNMETYLGYCIRRQVIAAELPHDFRRDWGVRTKSGELSPKNNGGNSSVSRLLLSPVDEGLNEHYLWHGTGPAEAAGIAEMGFDLDQAGSSRGALFGRGLYFAESCLKADEYVRPDDKGCFPLILCRVTLGHVNYCDAEDPWELRDTFRSSCRAGPGGFHSVLGDREKVRQTFREFVVFDGHQAYPEYIVWYTRK